MEQFILDVLEKMDIPHLIGIVLIGLFFYSRLEKKIEKTEEKLEKILHDLNKEQKQTNLIIFGMDKRIVAIETLIHMKECCILKENSNRKAE